MFGTLHVTALIVSLVFIAAGTVLAKKVPFDKVCRSMLVIGIIAEFIKVFAYTLMNEPALDGYLPKTDLPLHLCSFQVVFMAILVLSKNENAKRVLRSFMLPTCLFGGLAAIFIPTSSAVGSLNVITFEYFGYHAAIVIFALRMLLGEDMHFAIRDYASCLVMLFVVMLAAVYINSILYNGVSDTNFVYEVTDGVNTGTIQLTNVNFMYVVSPPVNGLPFLNEDHGWAVYFAHYLCLCVFCITLVYIKPVWRALTKKQ